jgi:ubiquitin-conjugating enzyme E2 O
MVRGRSDRQMRVGDKAHLENSGCLPTTTHGREGEPTGKVVVDTLLVKETCTVVDVLWQNGTHETLRSTELVPYLNPDESDCW